MDELKLPPHSQEAEKSVLGAMILNGDAIGRAIEIVSAGDFYRSDHKEIFTAILSLFNSNTPVDVVTLAEKLKERGTIETIGGAEYISNLMLSVPSTANIEYYAKIVEEKSILRSLINTSNEVLNISYNEKASAEDILEKAEKGIFDIAQKRINKDFESMQEVLIRSFDKLEQLQMQGNAITGVSTGFVDLDRMTSGLQPSDLILIAARPSMGKTAIALNIAQYAGVNKNVPVGIFSLEMSKEQLVNRMLCSQAMVESQKIRNGSLEVEDWKRLIKAVPIMSEAPIYIDDTPGIGISELRAKCRRLKLEKGLGLIVIDYLQLMSGASGKSESRQQEISEISRSLKAIAREMEAPVVALSQLSRAPEQRADHRPMLSDLRESGAIEQDADVVLFLYRDEYYNPESESKGIAEAIIAKQRNGAVGTIELTYMGQFTKFGNVERMVP
jgi:replicative DNA helicase